MIEANFQVENEVKLPSGWISAALSDVCEINPGLVWNDDFTDDLSVTFVPMAAVDDVSGTIVKPEHREIASVWKGYTRFAEGDVLFAKITPCMENGKAAIAQDLANGLGFGSTEFHVLRPTKAVLPKWIFYYIRQQDFRDSAARKMTGTAGQLRVPAKYLSEFVIPVAPISEQRRIIEELEAQFTRLDAGVEALNRLRTNLRRYKAAVLKAACEGKLVEQNPDDEPASDLLERTLKERRTKWEAEQLAKGKDPRKLKYEEPAAPITDDLPELPEGWVWASVEGVCERIVDCLHSTPTFTDEGFICLDTNAIKPGLIVQDKLRYVDEETFHHRNQRMKPRAGDVAFSREGALLGVGVMIPEDIDLCLGQRMMIFRLTEAVLSKFYENVLNSTMFRAQYVNKIGGSASPHLNIGDIRKLAIPIPPRNEQHKIVEAVEYYFSIIDALNIVVNDGLKRAERLRQSILREAFAGRLVSQDPDDEPATVLLEKIRAKKQSKKSQSKV